MIINQIKNKDSLISATALEILNEACHHKVYLEEIIYLWPYQMLYDSGDLGIVISTKLLSTPQGLDNVSLTIPELITNWADFLNKKYVLMIESDIHSKLTLSTKLEDQKYFKRICLTRINGLQPNILPHLYGQLTHTEVGIRNLKKYGRINVLFEKLQTYVCKDDNECLSVKASLWALGHMATSNEGITFLQGLYPDIYLKIVEIAKKSLVYSLRATAFNVLGLISSTKFGSEILLQLDWISVKHDRNTVWPINESIHYNPSLFSSIIFPSPEISIDLAQNLNSPIKFGRFNHTIDQIKSKNISR